MDISCIYTCKNCKKIYKRYNYYCKHILLCEGIDNIHITDRNIDIENPSKIQQMLEYLIASNMELKEQIKDLNREKSKYQNKIDIISWLNQKYNPDITYIEFINSIVLKQKILLMLEDKNLQELFAEIIDKIFNKNILIPIKAFNIKENNIFIFIKNKWIKITNNDIKLFINKISNELLRNLNVWQIENSRQIENDNLSKLYIKFIKNINKINISNNLLINSINKKIYEKINENIDIIEIIG